MTGLSQDAMIARLLALHPKAIDLSLGRIERLLDALGDPHRRLPPTIHVAGTNGKGSTVAFMRAILEARGLSVHVDTSPHLVRLNERIRVGRPGGGMLVDDATLLDALRAARRRTGASRSLSGRSSRRPPSSSSPNSRPTCSCWRWGWAAGSTPPTSSSGLPARS